MKKLLLLTFLVFIMQMVSAQNIIRTEMATAYSTRVFGNNFAGVIFSKDYTSEWLSFEKGTGKIYVADDTLSAEAARNPARYTPSTEDIDAVENYLQSGLRKLNRKLPKLRFVKGPNVYRHLQHYARQYFGFITENNEKIILINCFWDDRQEMNADTEWLKNYYKIFDGGNYYWNIKVNLTTHELLDFGVNGAL